MNLTHMRIVGWVNKMMNYYDRYKDKLIWGDQDLINIFFYYHPGIILRETCQILNITYIHYQVPISQSDLTWYFSIVTASVGSVVYVICLLHATVNNRGSGSFKKEWCTGLVPYSNKATLRKVSCTL